MFKSIEARPVFIDYTQRLKDRPAQHRVNALNEAHVKATSA